MKEKQQIFYIPVLSLPPSNYNKIEVTSRIDLLSRDTPTSD